MVEEAKRIHGLIIQPSQQAQDLLAAFHLGAQTVLAALAPHAVSPQGPGQMDETVSLASYGYEPDDNYGQSTLLDVVGMDPLRREAILSAYGLTVATPPEREPDPTAANLVAMMETDGIPVKPGPGGAVAKHEINHEEDE